MKTFTTVIAASALLSYVSGSPIQARANTCGSVPAGSGSAQPLTPPTGINTAHDCQTAVAAIDSCLAFLFGMVNGDIKCIPYNIAASQIPPQSSPDLLAYDLACPSVPAVVPTTSNPTGNPAATPVTTGGSPANSSPSSAGKDGDSNGISGHGTPTLVVRDNCGVTPTGPTGGASPIPIATPTNISDLPACLAACQSYTGCESCGFGPSTAGGAPVCNLYQVTAASVPPPAAGQQGYVVSDVGCSSSLVTTGGYPANSPLSNVGNSPNSNSSPSTAGNGHTSNGKSGNGSPQ